MPVRGGSGWGSEGASMGALSQHGAVQNDHPESFGEALVVRPTLDASNGLKWFSPFMTGDCCSGCRWPCLQR
eukprot:4203520-Alexandrium_andersonii.AAC.1